jgi:hypothetical protein
MPSALESVLEADLRLRSGMGQVHQKWGGMVDGIGFATYDID